REVAEDPAAGDVGERTHVRLLTKLADLLEVEPMWREQEVCVEIVLPDQRADEREAVRMQPARRQADDDVARFAAGTVDEPISLDDADTRPREVELALAVDARQLGRLASDEHAAGAAADLRRALDEFGDLIGLDSLGRDVVQEEEGVGSAAEHVVDAVGREIH